MSNDDLDLEAALADYRRTTSPAAFDDGFADRVMARVANGSLMTEGLQRVFVRLAPLAAAAVLLLAVLNVRGTAASGQSLVDRALGIRAVTLADAYSLDNALADWGVGTTEVSE